MTHCFSCKCPVIVPFILSMRLFTIDKPSPVFLPDAFRHQVAQTGAAINLRKTLVAYSEKPLIPRSFLDPAHFHKKKKPSICQEIILHLLDYDMTINYCSNTTLFTLNNTFNPTPPSRSSPGCAAYPRHGRGPGTRSKPAAAAAQPIQRR